MLRKRTVLIVAVIAAGLLGAAATVWVLRPGTSSGESVVDTNAYGYVTTREFVLMHGRTEIARVPRAFNDIDSHENKLIWTHNGGHVAFFADGPKEVEAPKQQLVVVESTTGRSQTIDCSGCVDITPIGDDDVLAMMWPDFYSFKRFSFAGSKVSSSTIGLSFYFDVEAFAASSRNYIATRQTELSPKYKQIFELTPIDGSGGQNVGDFESDNSYILATVTEATGRQTPTLAFTTRHKAGECLQNFRVFVYQLNGKFAETDLSATAPDGKFKGGIDIVDLWWGRDGKLRGSFSVWTCDPKGSSTGKRTLMGVSQHSLWKLEGNRWVKDTEAPTGIAREVGPNTYVSLELPFCEPEQVLNGEDCQVGSLNFLAGSVKKHIADKVLMISSPTMS